MMVFGITGGSGTGKSTVSQIFREYGVYVIDADKTAREVVYPGGKCLSELTEYFGSGIIGADRSLDRSRLAEIVFSDQKKLAMLNGITHKYIKKSIEEALSAADCAFAAIDGAAIISSPVQELCKFLVSVLADREIRIERICKRDGLSREAAEKRINSQLKDEVYIENSRFLIYNNRDKEFLRNETAEIIKKIKEIEV